ncbi:MAG: hypothetical protein P1U56_07330 [Saprospiraceae bacterium]|nr:hypothetical protein [Saprospiraceae bacterium]
MKLYNLIIALVCTLFIVSCGNEYDTTEYFDLEELPGYVAFDADGNTINPDRSVAEDAGAFNVFVEHPTDLTSDATANYTISGDAVWGVDYTIEGATEAGGSVVISSDRGNFAETYRGAVVVTALADGEVDGNKTLTLTLTNASNSSGDIAVGRGGTEYQRSINITLEDVDM